MAEEEHLDVLTKSGLKTGISKPRYDHSLVDFTSSNATICVLLFFAIWIATEIHKGMACIEIHVLTQLHTFKYM
jgi:hypothetical protein